jgi:hypothetical protein
MSRKGALILVATAAIFAGCPRSFGPGIVDTAEISQRVELDGGVVRCPATGTELALGTSAHALDAGAVALGPSGGVLIRAARQRRGSAQLFEDWSALHQLITGSLPDHVTVDTPPRFDPGRLTLDYSSSEDGQHFTLRYVLIQRDGAACRLTAIERHSGDGGTVDPLAGLRDAARSKDAPNWEVLEMALTPGAMVLIGGTPGYLPPE